MLFKKQIPFVPQQGQSDCGVACLATVIQCHGGRQTLEQLKAYSGTSIQGTTLAGLYQAAQQVGFDVEGLEAEGVHNLEELSDPAILHVVVDNRLNHFFVFYGFENDHLVIGDPAKGILKYTKEELSEVWKSRALLKLVPNKNFVKENTINGHKKKWITELVKEDSNFLLGTLFLGVIVSIIGLSTAILSQKLIDNILPTNDTQKLFLSLILVSILLFARAALSYLRGYFIIHQSKDFNNRIIQKFYDNLLRLPKSFFDTRKTGELIARMNDTRRIQTVISFLASNILIDLLVLIVSLCFVFFYSLSIGFVLVTSIPVYFLLAYLFNDKIIIRQKAVMSSYAMAESHYVDTIQGIGTIKMGNRENFFNVVNQQIYGAFQQRVFSLGKINIQFGWISETIGVVFIISVFSMSSLMVLGKSLQLGEMVALLSMAGGVIPSINRLVIANIQIQEAVVAFDRMFEFTSIKAEYSEQFNTSVSSDKISVSMRNLSFGFPGRNSLLRNITLDVSHGHMIALLGESGSGKSTLIQILQKFYEPSAGTIFMNDINLASVATNEWRGQIGVVPQNIKIFNESLLFNITLSDRPEDYEQAIKLCYQYGFHNHFEAFPQSYLTLLGEEGINISGGQQQLVALARALYEMV